MVTVLVLSLSACDEKKQIRYFPMRRKEGTGSVPGMRTSPELFPDKGRKLLIMYKKTGNKTGNRIESNIKMK